MSQDITPDINQANVVALLFHDAIIFGIAVFVVVVLKVAFDKTIHCYRSNSIQNSETKTTATKNKKIFPIVNSQRFTKLQQTDEEQLMGDINDHGISESDEHEEKFDEKNMKLQKVEDDDTDNSTSEA